MSAVFPFFGWAILLAGSFGLLTWRLLPETFELWRQGVMIALSVSLGFHMARAIQTTQRGGITALQTWLDSLAFLWVMAAFSVLPSLQGWVLLMGGWSWRWMVRKLWK